MAISRPFLLALLGVALLGATVFAVQNARNSADDSATVAKQPAEQAAPAPAPAPEPAQASGKLSAKDAVAAVLSPGTPVDSARFSISYDLRETGGRRERSRGTLAGTFASEGSGVPSFDVRVNAHEFNDAHKPVNYDFRMLSTGEEGYIGSGAGDSMHEIPGPAIANLGKLRDALSGSPVAKFKEFELSRWVKDAKVVGVEKVDGIDATHVSGKIVTADVVKDYVRLARAEAEPQGARADVPANAQAMARRAVENARIDAWVGADRVVRRMRVTAGLDLPKRLLDAGDFPRGTAAIDFRLSDVNDVEPIKAPANVDESPAKKDMGAKDAEVARNILLLSAMTIDAPGGISGTTYAFLRLNRMSDSEKVAKKVLRAVEQDREVVVFFRNARALDDKATAQSVKYLDVHNKKLAVFTDDVEHTRSYGKLLENLGVTQAPAIVFINRRGTASLVEGYVDGPSLAQVIADAR
jgi:hypothetical protein